MVLSTLDPERLLTIALHRQFKPGLRIAPRQLKQISDERHELIITWYPSWHCETQGGSDQRLVNRKVDEQLMSRGEDLYSIRNRRALRMP